jgi:nicotinamidase/pyrazinamidase
MPLNRRAALFSLCSGALWAASLVPSWAAQRRIKPGPAGALIVVDVQNCFVHGGTLAVEHGDDVVPVINRIAPAFRNVILTQDWHNPGHISFASSHFGKRPFDTVQLAYGNQVLWPDHCVQGTADAAIDPDLHVPQAQLILRKGFHKDIDSYSAFMEADRHTPTGLEAYLKQRGIDTLFVSGLATDFCVAWTALDARTLGFDTYVVEDACRGIDLKGSLAAAWQDMQAHGVQRIQSADIEI